MSAELRAWAAEHARSVGRSGAPSAAAPASTLELAEWRLDVTLEESSSHCLAVAVDGDDVWLVTSSHPNGLAVRDVATGLVLQQLHELNLTASWTGRHVLVPFTRYAELLDPRRGSVHQAAVRLEVEPGFRFTDSWPAVYEDGRTFYVTAGPDEGRRRQLVRVAADDRSMSATLDLGADVEARMFRWSRPDGRLLLCVLLEERGVLVWDPASDEQYRSSAAARAAAVLGVPGGPLLAAAVRGGVELRRLGADALVHTLDAGADAALATTTLPDGRPVLATLAADRVQVWDPATGALLSELAVPGVTGPLSLTTTPDGRLILATGGGGVHVWSTHVVARRARPPVDRTAVTWTADADVELGGQPVKIVALPGELASVASAGIGSDVVLCGVGVGAEPTRRLPAGSSINGLAALRLRDGRTLLAAATQTGAAHVWDVATGEVLRTVQDAIWLEGVALAELPDGRVLLAAGGAADTVWVWDVATGDRLAELPFSSDVRSIAAHVDGQHRLLLAAGGSRSDGRVWIDVLGATTSWSIEPQVGGQWTFVAWLPSVIPDQVLTCWALGDRNITLRETGAGQVTQRLSCGAQEHRLAVLESGLDGPLIAAVPRRVLGPIWVWDARSGAVLQTERDHGCDSVGLAALPDGRVRVLGAAQARLRCWTSDQPLVAPAKERAQLPDGLVDRTPAALTWPAGGRVLSVRWATGEDGGPLLAVGGGTPGGAGGRLQVVDTRAGTLLMDEPAEAVVRTVDWSNDSAPRLAVGLLSGVVRLVQAPYRGSAVIGAFRDAEINQVAWNQFAGATPWLATARADGASIMRQMLDWGTEPHDTEDPTFAVAWVLHDQKVERAVTGRDPSIAIYALRGNERRGLLAGHTAAVHALATAPSPEARLLASGSADRTVRIWDVETEECLHVLETRHRVWSVSWAALSDGLLVLAATDGTRVRIWDRHGTDRTPAHGDLGLGDLYAVALHQVEDGPLLLVAGGERGVRVLEVHLRTGAEPGPAVIDEEPPGVGAVLALGAAGAWLPLGLVTDLVTITARAPDGPLYDGRLRALAEHPGVQRLQELDWPAPARTAFAALLALGHAPDPRWAAPPGTGLVAWAEALDAALRSATAPATVAADLAALRAAADRTTSKLVTLLRIVGSVAATVDPLLPLRLARHAPALPDLTPAQRSLIAASTHTETRPRPNAASVTRTPGSVGVTRHGSVSTVLLSEHALPADMFRYRLVQDQLLHRHHPAHAAPPLRPVTLVLDTTPPSFGAPEALLRLLAHLMTTALWEAGHAPLAVTLGRPDSAVPVETAKDLLMLWTSRDLREPDLGSALRTAAATPHPVVTLTEHHLAAAHPTATRRRQLVTTHQPGRPPCRYPVSAFHRHLDPAVDDARIAEVVATVLATAHQRWTA